MIGKRVSQSRQKHKINNQQMESKNMINIHNSKIKEEDIGNKTDYPLQVHSKKFSTLVHNQNYHIIQQDNPSQSGMQEIQTSNQIDLLTVDGLDDLVDLKVRQYAINQMRHYYRKKIAEQIAQICLDEISNNKWPVNFGSNLIQFISNQKLADQKISHWIEQNKKDQNNQPVEQQLHFSSLFYLQYMNNSQLFLFEQIQALSKQKSKLQQQNQIYLYKTKKNHQQFNEVKQKYIDLINEFSQYKKQSKQNQILIQRLFQQKIQQNKLLQKDNQNLILQIQSLESKIKILQQNHQAEIDFIKSQSYGYYCLETFIFTTNLQQIITQFGLDSSFISSNSLKSNQSSENGAGLQTRFNCQNFQSRINQLESNITELLNQVSMEFTLKFDKVQQVYNLMAKAKQMIIQINSLQQYELKVQKKDLNKSTLAQFQSLQQSQLYQNEGIIDEVFSTIKTQIISLVKANRITSQQRQLRETKIQEQENKIKTLIKIIDQKINMNNMRTQVKKVNKNFLNSPIDILQIQNDSRINQNKDQLGLLRQFEYQHSKQSQLNLQQKKKDQSYQQQQNLSLIQQIILLKEENEKLKLQLNKLKLQFFTQNTFQQQSIKIQQIPEKMGKIKHISIKLEKSSRTSHINQKQNINYQPKQTIQLSKDHLLLPSRKNEKEEQNIKPYNNKISHYENKISQYENKISQYKQNILKLNQIINYMINQIRGYQFGRLFYDQQNNSPMRKIPNQEQNSSNLNNNLRMIAQNLPVRRHSHLEYQIAPFLFKNSDITLFQDQDHPIKNNTSKISAKIFKQFGETACLNTSKYSQSQTLTSKISLKQNQQQAKVSALISKETLKQKYENFEFIRKLCLKQKNCKELLDKFHSYLEFYIKKKQKTQNQMQKQKIVQQFSQNEYFYPDLKTNLEKSSYYNQEAFDEQFQGEFSRARKCDSRRNTQIYTVR